MTSPPMPSLKLSPSSIINLFNNALSLPVQKKVITVTGIYRKGNGQIYSGFYYDRLRDFNSDYKMTLRVPERLRASLVEDSEIEFTAFITKHVKDIGAISLVLNMEKLIDQNQNALSAEEESRLEVLRVKSKMGYRDVKLLIKSSVFNGKQLKVVCLFPNGNVTEQDFQNNYAVAEQFMQVHIQNVNFKNEAALKQMLLQFDQDQDTSILCLVRGGGAGLEIFDSPQLARTAAAISTHFITAIGHAPDVTLLQRIADEQIDNPASLGTFFTQQVDRASEELNNSKAILIERIKNDLQKQYAKQILNLQEKEKTLQQHHKNVLNDLEKVNREKYRGLNAANQKIVDSLESNIKRIDHQLAQKSKDLTNQSGKINQLQTQLKLNQQKQSKTWLIGATIGLLVGLVLGLLLMSAT